MGIQKTVLLIDDEIDLLEMIQYQLESKGMKVVTARDGAEGLEKLKTLRPHLIILDMNMPGMGGIEFYKKICDKDGKPPYPVFVLTARANMEQFFRDIDVDGFLPKPFEIDHLVKEVERVIRKREESCRTEGVSAAAWSRKICLVESDAQIFNSLAGAFLDAGYIVNSVKGGAAAIERIVTDIPDVVLIKLGLMDIPGDVVINRVKNLIRAANVIFILYGVAGYDRQAIRDNIGEGHVAVIFIDSDDTRELLDAVNQECRKRNK
jgi:DNA-binding response OmpR family regulator